MIRIEDKMKNVWYLTIHDFINQNSIARIVKYLENVPHARFKITIKDKTFTL